MTEDLNISLQIEAARTLQQRLQVPEPSRPQEDLMRRELGEVVDQLKVTQDRTGCVVYGEGSHIAIVFPVPVPRFVIVTMDGLKEVESGDPDWLFFSRCALLGETNISYSPFRGLS